MKKIKILYLIGLLLFTFSFTNVFASSFSISAGSKSLTKGNTTKLTIKGSDVTGRFNITTSNGAVVSISEDKAWIENDSYSITLQGLTVGTATITVTPASGVSNSNGNAVSLSSKSITINVSLPREKSSNSYLKSLEVEGYTFNTEFDRETYEYSLSVPEGTKSVKVNASASDNYAKVNGAGDVELSPGNNILTVVVTAENGSEKTYTINVNVIDENPIEVTLDGINYTVVKLRESYKCPDLFTDGEVNINEFTVPACTNENLKYNLVGLKDSEGNIVNAIYNDGEYTLYKELNSTSIKLVIKDFKEKLKGYKEVNVEIDGIIYKGYAYSKDSRFVILYGTNVLDGKDDYYVYDKELKTLSIRDTEYIDYLNDINKTYLIVIIIFAPCLVLLLICLIILLNKNKSNKSKKKIVEEETYNGEEKATKNKKKNKKNKKDNNEIILDE